MKRNTCSLAMAVMAIAIVTSGAVLPGIAHAAEKAAIGFAEPADGARMAKAQKTANALRTASASVRNALYNAITARGGRLAYSEMPLAAPIPALSDTHDAQTKMQLELLKRDGDPVAVLYTSDDDDDVGTVYHGYSVSTGASLTRTYNEVNFSRSSYLIVDDHSEIQLSELVAEANAEVQTQLTAFRHTGSIGALRWGGKPGALRMEAEPGSRDSATSIAPVPSAAATNGSRTWLTSVLHSIRADEEVKAAGDAEIYAIVVGYSYEGEPLMEVIQMPYFDRRYTTYTPDQVMVQWGIRENGVVDWDRAPWFEMIIMEYDRKESFQEVIQIALEKVTEVAVAAGGNPVIGMAGAAASAIVGAIPDYVFRGEDDYLDSFHLLQYNTPFKGRGAANNIHIDLVPHEMTFNTGTVFADLSVKQIVASGGSFYPYQKLPATVSVTNEGVLPSASWSAKFYLVPALGGTPVHIATGTAGSLNHNQVFNQHVDLPLNNAAVTPGAYRLRVDIETDGDVQPTNNSRTTTWSALIHVKAAPGPGDLIWAKPDLKATYIVGVQGDYDTSDTVETWFGFNNIGGGVGDFDVHFWAVHQSTGVVKYLAKGQSGGLTAGQSYAGIVDLPLTGLAPGQHKLVMQIAGVQGEGWTNNNIVPSLGTISVRADLTGELGN
ncbi:DUF3103 domain-containing protein [Tahibacter amnicola]|uniref:DUF3103 domain-containing protein n=1 Tax=Tahibacter amnicola TaxID=2976241 RepID=A0ABY6B857_9GAMM|nr:DUF3103 domain-containing protein [Tahibacter amnicola]UXI65859.1 DUF3103 domain-containing protein [Tahibacter amnicola]